MSYEHDMYENDDRLDEIYASYLDEICQCNVEEYDCNCISFDDWLEEKREERAELLAE